MFAAMGDAATSSRVLEHWPGSIVRYSSHDWLVASRGYEVLARNLEAKEWESIARIPAGRVRPLLYRMEPGRRLGRLGIRAYLQRDRDSFLAFSGRSIFYYHRELPSPVTIGEIRFGHAPLIQGCCVDDSGTCYYGEYSGTKRKKEGVCVWAWRPEWGAWRVFYRFPPKAIRHVHAVQFDPFWRKLWIATGDGDPESLVGYFEGATDAPALVAVASGSQGARAVSLIFTADFVYWGSDAGKDTRETMNYIYRWSRRYGGVERVAAVGGPVYYSTVDSRGRLFVSTAVEGSPSEKDAYARVWMSSSGTDWVEIGRWSKDHYPRLFGIPVFGNAVLSFPQGQMPAGKLCVTGEGVVGSPGTWILEV